MEMMYEEETPLAFLSIFNQLILRCSIIVQAETKLQWWYSDKCIRNNDATDNLCWPLGAEFKEGILQFAMHLIYSGPDMELVH